MKTKRFRLLTVILAAVMMFALSMNVMAAKSNTVTKDGLTAQLFTDKDSYKAGESVKASVQVDNHTGKKVYVITQITAPDGVVLENANVAFDAFLENGESWKAVGGVVTSNGNATGATATAGSTTATGDNMQAGFWVILTALAVCGLFALFVYGKNRTTWLSIMLCIAMVSGMVVAAVPAQAAGVEGSISLSCTIQVDGKDEVISATVSYMSYEEDVEDTDDTAEAATPSEPRQESSEPSQESSEPSQESSEPSQESSEPSQEPSEPSQESSEPEAVVDTLYVSASATVGAGDGSINNPFANIEEAQALIREIKDANAYPEQGITVYFRQGQYRIDKTITFEEADSGKEGAPVVYSAYNNETVMFTGGININLSEFENITDNSILNRLADGAENKIKQIDLAALGITDYGKMNVYGHSASYFPTAGIEIPEVQAPELFLDGDTMSIARYPNEGWVYIKSVVDTGDVIQNWTQYASGNDFIPESERVYPPKGSIFTIDDTTKARMARWSGAEEPWVYGYWKETWSDQSMPVEYMVAETGTVKTKIPSGKKMTAGMYFYFYNLLEEIDVPGEYFIDRSNGILYFYPTKESGTVTLSLLEGDMVVFAEGTHDIELIGIEFRAGRNYALTMDGVERVNIENCDINKFANQGVYMADSKDVTIKGCHLYDLGKGGIFVTYDTRVGVGLEMLTNLENMGIVVENCEINNFSRIQETYSPAVTTAGVGMVVRNCKIYDSTHMAIQLGGNDTLIENNEIFNVLQTSTDSGVFYGVLAKQEMGTVIRNNYIHDISSSAGTDISVVYCDDTKDGVTAESNLIVNFNGTAAKINGGWDNNFRYNVLINTQIAAAISSIGMRGDDKYDVANYVGYSKLKEVYSYPAYLKYPHWEGKVESLLVNNAPMHNTIKDNVIINVNQDIKYNIFGEWTVDNIKCDNTVGENHSYYLSEVGFANIESEAYIIDEYGDVVVTSGDFTISEDSVLFDEIENFATYDFSQIGLIGEGTEAPTGPLGPLDTGTSDILMSDAFDKGTLRGWQKDSLPQNCYAEVNEAEQLVIGASTVSKVAISKYFPAYAGTVSYEFEYTPNGYNAGFETKVIPKGEGKDSTGATKTNQSLVNIQVNSTNMTVSTYDGGGSYTTNKVCEEGVTYKFKLVADPVDDTYDLYVKKANEEAYGSPIIKGRKLRIDVESFTGIYIEFAKISGEGTPEMYLDNLIVQKYDKSEEEIILPEGYLLLDEFSKNELVDWMQGSSVVNTYVKVNDSRQLEIGMSGSGNINIDKKFIAAHEGKVSYELDFMVNRNGSTDIDPGVVIARGTANVNGTPTADQSILNIKAYNDSTNGNVFGAYDGTGEHPTSAPCEDGVVYKVKLVVDPKTDKYDLYVKKADAQYYGKPIIEGSPLRCDAVSFDGVRISTKRTSGGNTPTMYYDNLSAQIVEDKEAIDWEWAYGDQSKFQYYYNEDGQLQIDVTDKVGFGIKKFFEAQDGKATVEFDFMADRGDNAEITQNLLVLQSNLSSLVKINAIWNTDKYVFETEDGGSGASYATTKYQTTVECTDNTSYRIKLVVDMETDTYDLYVKETSAAEYGDAIVQGRNLRINTKDAFDAFSIDMTNKSTEYTATFVYDNFVIQKVEEEATPTEPDSGETPEPIMEDNFSGEELSGWNPTYDYNTTTFTSNINAAGQMEISMNARGGLGIAKKFEAYAGKLSCEFDFMMNRNGTNAVDPGIILVRSGNTTMVNIKSFIIDKNGEVYGEGQSVFGAYDGGSGSSISKGTYATTTACTDNVWYKMKLVVDPESDTYDLYAREASAENYGDPIIAGRKLLADATSFDNICISITNYNASYQPRFYYDNLIVQKVVEEVPTPTVPPIMKDDFSENTLSEWEPTYEYDTTKFTLNVNATGQMEISMNARGGLGIAKEFEAYAGKLSCEFDFMMNRNGTNAVDPGIILVRSGNTTMVNIKSFIIDKNGEVYGEGQSVFGAYDGGSGSSISKGTYATTTACTDNVWYKMKLVVDPESDTYDLYAREASAENYGDPIIAGRKLLADATSFDNICINITNYNASYQPKFIYDNIVIQAVE